MKWNFEVFEVTPSKVKLEEYNERVSAEDFNDRLSKVEFEAVDLRVDRKYQTWINNGGTVVFKVPKAHADLAELVDSVAWMHAHEINYVEWEDSYIFRLWWD